MNPDQTLALIHATAWPLLLWLLAKLNRKGGNK